MKLLKLKWSQEGGLVIDSHCKDYESFKPTRPSDLLDVSRFSYIAQQHGWPEIDGDGWHIEVHRALTELKITDFGELTLFTRVGLALINHGLLRHGMSLEDALAALERERGRI